ncbi:MAG TPA: peptidylprolyl isomerase [bacterium]|nr:peptidylprolyl isomerase [bacterium]
MLKRTLLFLGLALIATLIVVACTGPQGSTAKKSGEAVATVGSSSITVDDYQQILDRIPPFNRRRYASKNGKMELLDKLVEEELFYQEAMRKGLDKDEEFTSRMEQIRRGILASMVKKELYDEDVEVTEADVKKYYDENQDKFMTPETIKVKLILIRLKRNATAEEEAAAKAKADEALKKLKGGANWDAIVEQYSEDRGTKKRGGVLPKVRKGMRGEEFDAVAFAMSTPNQISDVFKDKRGFNIVQFVEKTPAELKDFASVEKSIERRMKQEKLKERIDGTLESLRTKANVKVYEDVLDGIQVDAGPEPGAPGAPGLPAIGGEGMGQPQQPPAPPAAPAAPAAAPAAPAKEGESK